MLVFVIKIYNLIDNVQIKYQYFIFNCFKI